MKKFLLAVIVLVLSAGAALSEGAGSPFIASLEEAVSSFDLDRNGYRLDVSAAGQDVSAALQYERDQGIVEINLEEYGLLQLDRDKAAWQNGGTTWLLDYSLLSGLITGDGDSVDALRRAGSSIAAKAMKHLVDPFVEYGYSRNTFIMHLDIGIRELRSRLGSFTEELMQEKIVREAYPVLAAALRSGGVWLPENPEDLPDYVVSLIPDDEYTQGRLIGDLQITPGRGGVPDVVFSGDYHFGYSESQGMYPLYFELSMQNGRLSVYADGDTPVGGATLALDGGRFRLSVRRYAGESPRITVDGTYDPATGEISAVICDGNGEKVGGISGSVTRDRLSLEFRCYSDYISLYARYGRQHLYAKAVVNSRAYEVWAGQTPDDGISARIHFFNPVSWTDDVCAFLVGRDRFDFDLVRNGREILDLSALHDPETGGIDVSGTLEDDNYRLYQVHLIGAGTDYAVEYSFPYYSWRIEGKGNIRFSPGYLLQSAVFDVNVAGGGGATAVYALERTEDTPEKMVYQLRKDREVLWQLELGLPREIYGRAFTLRDLRGEDPVFAASVTPIAKETVIPFDTSNAIRITPEMINTLVQTLTR